MKKTQGYMEPDVAVQCDAICNRQQYKMAVEAEQKRQGSWAGLETALCTRSLKLQSEAEQSILSASHQTSTLDV